MEIKIIQIILFQGLFLAFYMFWLHKETFYTANRLYLLGSSILALFLPFISLSISSSTVVSERIISLSEVILTPQQIQLPEVVLFSTSAFSNVSILAVLYGVGVLISLLYFLWKINKLVQLIRQNKVQQFSNNTLVNLPNTNTAFSFLNYIFIGEQLSETDRDYIIKHEKVHVTHQHSLDLLWFEFLKIIMWFNPLIYMYQKKIVALHEFIADAETVKNSDTKNYYNQLLNDLFQVENMAFVNQFYHKSLLKKRIIMLTKNKSANWKQMKYLSLIPVVALMLSISFSLQAQESNSTVVITEEVEANDPIGLGKVDTAPIYPGCEGKTDNKAIKKCFFSGVANFVSQNFDITTTHNLGLTGGMTRIYTQFIVDKYGNVKDIKVNAPHQKIKEEVMRVVNSLPTMKPAIHQGKPVEVLFTLPIVVEIEEEEIVEEEDIIEDVSFRVIEEAPIFPGCENEKDKAAIKKCFSRNVNMSIAKNFNADLGQKLNLKPGIKRISVQFIVDKQGNIGAIKTRAPHEALGVEAKRVVNLLPKMIPAKQDGKNVSVKFNLPIVFEVQAEEVKKK